MGQRVRHYLDCAASTPEVPASIEAARLYDRQDWAGANPNSLHSSGRAAFAALGQARAGLCRSIGASRPDEVVFTGGGSESNAIALHGLAHAARASSQGHRRRIVVSALEHDSVLEYARHAFRDDPWRVDVVGCTGDGVVDVDRFEALMGDDVAVASVMAVNNELGTVQPVQRLAQAAHRVGALFHTDAVQALGRVPVDVSRWGVDAASFAAHKVGAPVGIGSLYVKSRVKLFPLTVGGGQESGLRPGTVDVRGALCFSAAASDAVKALAPRSAAMRSLAARLSRLCCEGEGACARLTVDPRRVEVAPGFVHLLVPGHQTEGLIVSLDELGFEVSGGSACSSSSLEPSHVLTAIGVERDLAFCALRITFDYRVTLEDIEGFSAALISVCADGDRLRRRRR